MRLGYCVACLHSVIIAILTCDRFAYDAVKSLECVGTVIVISDTLSDLVRCFWPCRPEKLHVAEDKCTGFVCQRKVLSVPR